MDNRYDVELFSINGKTAGGHVTSKISQRTYRVEHMPGNPNSWTCDCQAFFDAIRTGADSKTCRHISAYVERMKTPIRELGSGSTLSDRAQISCRGCGSTNYKKAGIKKNKYGNAQIYRCKTCNKRFVHAEPGFERLTHGPQVIASALNMVMSGMSYRKTAEHLYFVNNIRISHTVILYWVKKYTAIIKRYTDALRPIIGDVLSVDEAVINVKKTNKLEGKGNVDWLWSAIDPKTRLVLASMISTNSRSTSDASKILEICKKIGIPNYLVTDSLSAYDSAALETLPTTSHVKTKSIRDGFTNMAIERYHNEIREKLKSCRGLGNDDSAAVFANLLYIHHNFVRPHMGLGGKTPAEEAGMITRDTAKGKYYSLIKEASSSKISGNWAIARKLGKHASLVTIHADHNDVRVVPNDWIENDVWCKMTTLLNEIGLVWMFNHVMRCWIKFENGPPTIVPADRKKLTPI